MLTHPALASYCVRCLATKGGFDYMTFFLNVPLDKNRLPDTAGEVRRVETRAHATELVYSDASHLKGIAEERWPDIEWRVEHVRTGRFIVKGDSNRKLSGRL